MANLSAIIQRAFAGGELSPALFARADVAKYQQSLKRCRNFLVRRTGGVANRPGTRYIASVKTAATPTKLLRYVSEISTESVLIEMGHQYFRFFNSQAPITLAGVPAWSGATNYVAGDLVSRLGVNYYCILAHTNQQPPNATFWYAMPSNLLEIPHPYSGASLPRWTQSGSVITLTHPSFQPRELRFNGLTSWTLVIVTTEPGIAAPTGLTGTGTAPGTEGQSFKYVVTAADENTYEESEPSNIWEVIRAVGPKRTEPFTLIFDGFQAGVKAQAAEYYIYCDPFSNGIYGFLATAVWNGVGSFHFHDIGFPPDFSQTPPLVVRLFTTSNNFPAMAAYFQQRRWFANTNSDPEGIFASRLGFPNNFGISSPLQDDDAMSLRLAGPQRHPVQHLIGLGALVILTQAGEWILRGAENGPIIPTALQADQVGYWGASEIVPAVVGQSVIYVQTRGRIVRDLVLDRQGIASRDLTLFAGHLFKGFTITALDLQQNPDSIVWAIRSDGGLLGLTYVPDDDVFGWHRHDSGASAVFKDVCVVPEVGEDGVYFLVNRTINSVAVRYIERLASRDIVPREDQFFVDAGLTYDGAPTASVTGLGHLEGQVVAVLGDGVVVFNGDPAAANAAAFTVTAGAITLPASRSVIQVGLAIRHAEIETLTLDVAGSAIRNKKKRVQSLTAIVEKSAQVFYAGPDVDHLVAYRPPPWVSAATAATLVDDDLELNLTAAFGVGGRVFIRQIDPLPLTILGLIPDVEIGG